MKRFTLLRNILRTSLFYSVFLVLTEKGLCKYIYIHQTNHRLIFCIHSINHTELNGIDSCAE